jgi:hypothetical protein
MTKQQARNVLVQTLRRGEYTQGRKRLRRTDNTYCCLGVACEIYKDATGQGEWEKRSDSDCYGFFMDGQESRTTLPGPVKRFFGFMSEKGAYFNDEHALSADNDQGASFKEIANIIESNPEGMFQND